jgi:membrane protein YdbS with pleckstrin-like domain
MAAGEPCPLGARTSGGVKRVASSVRVVTQRRLWLRLADLVMLVIAVLIAVGLALNAVNADHWPVRLGLGVIAVWFAVMSVRIAPGLIKDWRRPEA